MIYDSIFQYAKSYITTHSQYSPLVLKVSPQQQKKFPLVIIRQIRDPLIDENLDKTDQRFKIVFEIEIYAIDKAETIKEEITEELIGLVNDVFDEHYGFNRKTNANIPNIDLNVNRQHMRYEGKLDENNIIYRR